MEYTRSASNGDKTDMKVLLGISGGIAAYKAADLASKLTAAGARCARS